MLHLNADNKSRYKNGFLNDKFLEINLTDSVLYINKVLSQKSLNTFLKYKFTFEKKAIEI